MGKEKKQPVTYFKLDNQVLAAKIVMKFDKNAVNRTKKYDLKKQPRSIYKSNEIMAIFLCVNCYGFANVLMDNVWQHVTQPFGYSMSPESHNMAC